MNHYITTSILIWLKNELSRYSDSLRAVQSGDRIPVGARFYEPVQTGPWAHPASYTTDTRSFQGVKWPGHGIDHPPPAGAKVEEGVELYVCPPLWAFMACSRVNFIYVQCVCTLHPCLYIFAIACTNIIVGNIMTSKWRNNKNLCIPITLGSLCYRVMNNVTLYLCRWFQSGHQLSWLKLSW
jgi:hypothetical protein